MKKSKVRVFKSNTQFNNNLVQAGIKFDNNIICFNGYMTEDDILGIYRCLLPILQTVEFNHKPITPKKNLNTQKTTFTKWCKERNISVFTEPTLFTASLSLHMNSRTK